MASKLDSTSKSSSTKLSKNPKISLFGVKSGFVIPKNKLSGSLVPIFRGGGKIEPGESGKEEISKKIQRKTRWGIDLSQDASVRRARSLAYQTRVEQIMGQLESRSLELGDDEGVDSVEKSNVSENLELLELEKRELIGEILRLNPNYKVPSDYKPLMKEAKVPILVKAHPGYNPIGVILGPESNTQKRLEEETGAKVCVYGTNKTSKEKCEITRSDVTEAQETYDDLYINISADTYEKVDAAVSLVELLLTPVFSVPAAVSSGVNTPNVNPQSVPESTPLQSTSTSQPESQPFIQSFQVQSYPRPWTSQFSPLSQTPAPMTYQYSPLTIHTTSQSTPVIRPLQLAPQQGPPSLISVSRQTSMFNMVSPHTQATVGQQANAPPRSQSPFPQHPPPITISPSHRPSSSAYPMVQNQPPQFPSTGFIPLKPPPNTSGQFTFQPHRVPSPSFRPLAQNQQPLVNIVAAPPRLPIYGNPNPVNVAVPPRPPFYGNPNQGITTAPARLPIYGNASALIQAHGQHVQGPNMVIPSPGFVAPARPIKQEMDPEYEDLMASVGVK